MMTWWDEKSGRYKYSLSYKVMYIWGWPIVRGALFLLPPETAHKAAVRVLAVTYSIERIWTALKFRLAVSLLWTVSILIKIPGFRCEPPEPAQEGGG